jgi:hypothetical protein
MILPSRFWQEENPPIRAKINPNLMLDFKG